MPALTERDGELALLGERIDRLARDRRGGAVLVTGPPGVGKTALLEAAADRAALAGVDVAGVAGREIEQTLALGVVERLIGPVVDARGAVAGGPTLAALADQGHDDHVRAASAISRLLEGLVAERPLVACVDDLQWADDESVEVLCWLLEEWAGEVPVLFVLGLRDGDATAPVAERIGAAGADRLRPLPLSATGVGILLAGHGAAVDERTVRELRARTNGVPFFVVELARHLGGAGQADGIPATVQEAIGRRLAALDGDALATIRMLAVLDVAEPAVVAEAMARPLPTVEAAGQRLRDHGLLDDSGAFEHPLVREAIHAGIPPSTRTVLHGRAARALLARGDRRGAAVHALASAPTGDAAIVAALRAEAAVARRDGSAEHAIRLLRRAIEEPPGHEALAELFEELADLLIGLGHFDEAVAAARRLRGLDGDGRGTHAFRAELLEARALTASGRAALALPRLRRLLGDRQRSWAPEERLEAEALLTTAAAVTLPGFGGWTPAEITPYEEAFAVAPMLAWSTLGMRARYEYLVHGDRATVVDLSRRGLVPPADAAMSPIVTVHMSLGATGLVACGLPHEALALLSPQLDRTRATCSRLAVALLLVGQATARFAVGDLRRCEEEVTEFRQLPGAPQWDTMMLPLLCQCLREQGRYDEAEAAVTAVLDDSDPQHRARARHAHGQLLLARGADHEALQTFDGIRADEQRDPALAVPHRTWRGGAALALLRLGRVDEARALAEEHLEHAAWWDAAPLIGEAHRVMGEVAGDPAIVERALPTLEQHGIHLELAHCLFAAGRLHRRAGRRSVAADRIDEALRIARRCGAHALVDAASSELAVLRSRPQPLAFSGLDALTAAERRVARLAVEGLSSERIAGTLFVSRRTVENHLGRAYRKLDVAGREELRARLAEGAFVDAGGRS